MPIELHDSRPPEPADARFWIPFAASAAIVFLGAIAFFAIHGVGGLPVAQNEQQPAQQAAAPVQPAPGNQTPATTGAGPSQVQTAPSQPQPQPK